MDVLRDHIGHGYTNRVADAIYFYAEQEAQLKISNPLQHAYDPHTLSLKLEFYTTLYNTFQKKANRDEKFSLRYVRHEMAKINARLHPTFLRRILFSRPIDAIRNFVNGNNLLYAHFRGKTKSIEKQLLREHNLQAVTNSLKENGFRLSVENILQKLIAQDLPAFHFRYTDIHYAKTDFVLHFKKVPRTDLYYFEKFEAVSRPSLDALLRNDPSCVRHSFCLQDKIRFTAGETAHLVNGKAVCKKVDGIEQWLLLNSSPAINQTPFVTLRFDLEHALQKLPIRQLKNPVQYQALLQTLKSGSSKEVTFDIGNKAVKYFVEAAPACNTVNVLDRDNSLVDAHHLVPGERSELNKQLMEKIQDEVIDMGQFQGKRLRVR